MLGVALVRSLEITPNLSIHEFWKLMSPLVNQQVAAAGQASWCFCLSKQSADLDASFCPVQISCSLYWLYKLLWHGQKHVKIAKLITPSSKMLAHHPKWLGIIVVEEVESFIFSGIFCQPLRWMHVKASLQLLPLRKSRESKTDQNCNATEHVWASTLSILE